MTEKNWVFFFIGAGVLQLFCAWFWAGQCFPLSMFFDIAGIMAFFVAWKILQRIGG